MKKKICSMVAMMLALTWVLTACGGGGNYKNPEPNSEISGFYSLSQKVEGGNKKETKNVNVHDLQVSNKNDSSEVTIGFETGSMASGVDTAKIGSLPKYTVYGQDAPYRLVVKLENVTFWDYADSYEGYENDGIVLDVFQPYTSTDKKENGQDVYLYIQLDAESAYQLEEKDGELKITLKNVAAKEQQQAYYALSPLYYDWEKMIDKVDLTPTLCADFNRYQLISPPFASEEEAKKFVEQVKPKLEELNLTDSLIVKKINKGALPELTPEDEKELFSNKKLVKVKEQEKPLSLLMAYGKYLCTTPDGNKMLFAKDVGSSQMGESAVELYTTEMSGKATKLEGLGELSSIDQAGYSSDGNRLAILSHGVRSELIIYNFGSKRSINLGEEGIGNDIASFAWDQKSDVIHVVAGDNGAYQLKTYDYSKPGGQRISVPSERPLDQNGSFAFHGNEVYYSIQTTQEAGSEGAIYKVDKTSGKTEQVTKGIAFEISPDGKHMAVEDITDAQGMDQDIDEGAPIEGLKIIDLATKEEKRVVSNTDIAQFVWTKDSGKVYFSQNQSKDNPKETLYRYGLYSYVVSENKKDKILDMASQEFWATKEPNTLLVFDFADQFFATYIMDMNALNK